MFARILRFIRRTDAPMLDIGAFGPEMFCLSCDRVVRTWMIVRRLTCSRCGRGVSDLVAPHAMTPCNDLAAHVRRTAHEMFARQFPGLSNDEGDSRACR